MCSISQGQGRPGSAALPKGPPHMLLGVFSTCHWGAVLGCTLLRIPAQRGSVTTGQACPGAEAECSPWAARQGLPGLTPESPTTFCPHLLPSRGYPPGGIHQLRYLWLPRLDQVGIPGCEVGVHVWAPSRVGAPGLLSLGSLCWRLAGGHLFSLGPGCGPGATLPACHLPLPASLRPHLCPSVKKPFLTRRVWSSAFPFPVGPAVPCTRHLRRVTSS